MQTTKEALIGHKVAQLNSYVIGQTLVDGYLLIEDDKYLALMTKGLTNNEPMESIANSLLEYVNNNY
jgi:hypothetical protein